MGVPGNHELDHNTLTDDVQDRLKAAEDALASVTQKLKDQDDTITLLK
jgi:hypothetical protein